MDPTSDERARHWVRGPSVLLQLNFPDTLAQLSEAFPGTPEEAVAGYRRRVWRHHVQSWPRYSCWTVAL